MRPIPVDLKDGKPRALKFGAGAYRRLERELLNGRGLFNVLVDYIEVEPPTYIVTGLLWAGLIKDEPMLTLEAVETLVDAYVDADPAKRRIADFWIPIGEGLLESGIFRRPGDREEAPANPQKPATEPSSPSPAGLN